MSDQTQPSKEPIVIRIENSSTSPKYLRLFDENWKKEGIIISIPAFDDPTIAHPQKNEYLGDYFKDKKLLIEEIYLWCPSLRLNLDLFTLHFYESGEDPDVFNNLRIFFPRYDLHQINPDIVVVPLPGGIFLNENTRLSFIVPAVSKMTIDFFTREY